ncbi:sarcosine oxidase subunit gamma [Paracoccus salsus]|uniref:sarcosine oxidase subunit gamma n=1 Tax=Paracoccus salsus TaxID=2911061 RepID=UPI001F3EC987|nr:sarcosine oxidase subunit gamma family protein [Paracoccus salsus]MCF3975032.1 sarcosine oxidase subunit gamma [Paracoccus salsus]
MNTQKHDFTAAPVQIEELAPAARFSLRVRPDGRAALAQALGLDLPGGIGDRTADGGREALCLGPDEWLILAPEAAPLAKAAASVYADAPHSLTEISDREITLRLSGPQVLDLLASCCPRDVEAMPEGRGCRTVYDSATVTLWRDGPTEFRMDVWRSFLPHVLGLMALTKAELQAGL